MFVSEVSSVYEKMYYLCSHHEGTMDIYHHKWPQKAIVIPRGEAPRVTMKLFEVTSGGKFPLYPSDDYINGIVYAEKTPVKPFLCKG